MRMKDNEIANDLHNWFFDKVVKEDKFTKEFKKVLPILMENISYRIWWDNSEI